MSHDEPHEHGPLAAAPPEAWAPLRRFARGVARPIERFLRIEAASGILLLAAAAIALGWANSPWADTYLALWRTPCGIRIGPFAFERPLDWVVNDGLMVIFFFVVGMEIRRELHHGELSHWRRAALPLAAALGGMLAPAALYMSVAAVPSTRSGWGVPMATDIAFAVGILALLGKRVPAALRVLLLALAVIDDLGAIVVIALFYSSGVVLSGLLVAALGLASIFALQRFGVRAKLAYVPSGLVVWAGIYGAGIHPTIAGVIVGSITPVTPWLGRAGFINSAAREIQHPAGATPDEVSSPALAHALHYVGLARREALAPSESLIHKLHPWVAYGIMPLFALANAGVRISSSPLDAAAGRVLTGVIIGLALGKPIGVLLACGLSLRAGVAKLPTGMSYRHLIVLGTVAGVGFTMALFIAQLAFSEPKLLAAAKLGVLVASGAAALLGLASGRLLLRSAIPDGAAQSTAEAEGSTEK